MPTFPKCHGWLTLLTALMYSYVMATYPCRSLHSVFSYSPYSQGSAMFHFYSVLSVVLLINNMHIESVDKRLHLSC